MGSILKRSGEVFGSGDNMVAGTGNTVSELRDLGWSKGDIAKMGPQIAPQWKQIGRGGMQGMFQSMQQGPQQPPRGNPQPIIGPEPVQLDPAAYGGNAVQPPDWVQQQMPASFIDWLNRNRRG